MGNGLDRPVTDKHTTPVLSANGLRAVASGMQGYRLEMEDAHSVVISVDGYNDLAWFAVFDGHGGALVALKAAERLLAKIMATKEWTSSIVPPARSGSSGAGAGVTSRTVYEPAKMQAAIRAGFFAMDDELRALPPIASGEDRSGCTAIAALVTPAHIFFANCGDSRGMLISKKAVKYASEDHKPYNTEEVRRIEAAGGTVIMRRVGGDLAVSRALGDFVYKMSEGLGPEAQQVSAEPEISVIDRVHGEDEFLVLACDGVWDVFGHDDIVEYLGSRAAAMASTSGGIKDAVEDLLSLALDKGSKDNISAMVVDLRGGPLTRAAGAGATSTSS